MYLDSDRADVRRKRTKRNESSWGDVTFLSLSTGNVEAIASTEYLVLQLDMLSFLDWKPKNRELSVAS